MKIVYKEYPVLRFAEGGVILEVTQYVETKDSYDGLRYLGEKKIIFSDDDIKDAIKKAKEICEIAKKYTPKINKPVEAKLSSR